MRCSFFRSNAAPAFYLHDRRLIHAAFGHALGLCIAQGEEQAYKAKQDERSSVIA